MAAHKSISQAGAERDVSIEIGDVALNGTVAVPLNAAGIVLFAHGSGSSHLSPRNRYVAHMLQSQGIAMLLFDLLTPEEESVDQYTSELRFNIDLLGGTADRCDTLGDESAWPETTAAGLFRREHRRGGGFGRGRAISRVNLRRGVSRG